MNMHLKAVIRAGIHKPQEMVLWSSTWRGRTQTYVIKDDRMTPLESYLQEHGEQLSPAEAALVARAQVPSAGNKIQ
jgi:hypothetical protein